MKKLRMMAGLLAAALCLSCCPSGYGQAQTVLHIVTESTYRGGLNYVLQDAVNAFSQSHAGVTLELEILPYEESEREARLETLRREMEQGSGPNGTQYPTEILMAQTWSKEIATKIGSAMGQEFAAANNYGWYGPAMNLHRSAFSGRNFEYYSEDAVLSGLFASCEVNGAAQWGVYPYIKHFAANDQETNRTAFLTTWMTEQTLRENCLKPFEIVVKHFDFENHAMGIMTAYNWLGYTPVISDSRLLNTVLRDQWGFKGVVISDYNGSYGYQYTDAAIRNGNDLMLGYGMAESNQVDTTAATVVIALRKACKNILYTVANSGYYKDATAMEISSVDNMGNLFKMLNTGTVIGAIVLEALVLIPWILKKRKASPAQK